MERIIGGVATVMIVMGLAGLIIFGPIELISVINKNNEKSVNDSCSQIAKIGDVKEWQIGEDRSCQLVKDGKIITIKRW